MTTNTPNRYGFAGRRDFLRKMGGIAAVPILGPLADAVFAAGPFSDYRALVCVYMFGGNDAHNLIVPLDSRFASYRQNRGPLALPQASLEANAINDPVQGSFGLHPRLKNTAALYKSGKLAVVSNVGVLLRPTTKFDYQNRISLPPQLFSHNDMQSGWQTCRPGENGSDGWGGRLGDLMLAANAGKTGLCVVVGGNGSQYFKGTNVVAQEIAPFVPRSLIAQRLRALRYFDTRNSDPQGVFRSVVAMPRTNLLERQYGLSAVHAIEVNDLVLDAIYVQDPQTFQTVERVPIRTVFPADRVLSSQLRSVAMMIAARQALGVKRQLFFVGVQNSFDHHSDQFDASSSTLQPGPSEAPILFGRHADLLAQVDAALKAFYDATVELGVQDSVTTFTGSEFGRTLTSNGKGSDHGWGGHQMVMGGAVRGGRIYGAFHNMQVGTGNPADAGQGRLIPDFSVDQYAATLARWVGANAADLNVVFPNLRNFGSVSDLGFMN